MKKLAIFLLVGILSLLSVNGFGQSKIDPKDLKDKMQWFGDGKISFCMADEQPGEIVAGALIMSPYEIIGLRVEN